MGRDRIRVLFIYSLLSFFTTHAILASNKDYYYYQLSIDKGLSQSSVTSILLGSDGLWLGTKAGLNLFDWHQIKSFFYDKNKSQSLPGNYIYFVTEDKFNNKWVGTNKGLVRYHRPGNTFLPVTEKKATLAYSFLLQEESIYFGGKDSLYEYDQDRQKFECYPVNTSSDNHFNVDFILKHGDDELILLSKKFQMLRFNLKTHSFSTFTLPDACHVLSAAFQDHEGNYYLAPFGQGVYCFDKNWEEKYHLSTANGLANNMILDMLERDDKLWLATDGGGINIVDKATLDVTVLKHIPGEAGSLPVNSIICLYKDGLNNIFAGTVRGGMIGIREVSIKTFADVPMCSANGLNEKSVISLYEDSHGILWIGTDGGGVNRYDPQTNTFKHYPLIASGKVLSLTEFSESELLVSFYSDRTYLFNKQTGKCVSFDIVDPKITAGQCGNDFVELAFRLSKDRIYFLSSDAYIYNVHTHSFSKLKTKENQSLLQALNPIYADEENAYFIQNRESRILEVSQNGDSLRTILNIGKNKAIMAACRDQEGVFWIGTDEGLFSFNPKTEEYKKIDTRLFSNVSTLLYDGQGKLWIGAQNMLFLYDIRQKKLISWDESDGFSPNELSYMYQPPPQGKNIYLGGVNGLVCIDRDIVLPPKALPETYLSDVIVDGSSLNNIPQGTPPVITLPWSYSSLIINVSSIEKDILRKKLFRFHVEGVNLNRTTYEHALSLNSLPSGKYSIMVSCNTKNGVWTAPQNILRIIVTPPWYKKPMIISLIILLIIIILLGGVRFILRRKEKKMQWLINLHEQKINKEKIQFLINISHELRTPLTLAYAPLKRILDRKEWEIPENNTGRELNAIYKQLHRMRELINMVLDQNSISEGENSLRKAPHSVNEWIETIADDFREEMKEKKIHLKLQLDKRNPVAAFDAIKCRAVLSNLLMNALKFSTSGTEITVKSEMIEQRIRISVCDEGIGLDNVDTGKLFTRYYQGKHNEIGSGIGLSYSKVLIEKHGGSIGVMKNEPIGAIFYFEFPQNIESSIPPNELEDGPPPTASSCTAIDNDQFDTTGYSIVVAEDNEELLDFLKHALQPLFKHVYAVDNGCKALEIIISRFPDIIVSDVMMPYMDGFELCRKVKEDINVSHIPVILLTARGDLDSKDTGYKSGADAYLAKPFEEELLMTIIVNQLKNREAIKQKYREQMHLLLSKPVAPSNPDEEFLLKLNKLISENMAAKTLDVEFLTKGMSMSRTPLFTKLKALTNMGINDYINHIRIETAAQLLLNTTMSIMEISDTTGFSTPKYFSTIFRKMKEKTPSQYRKEKEN